MTHNNMCDGSHCRSETGPVKLYPIGGGGNAIFCRACWDNENKYRANRGGEHSGFPILNWYAGKDYTQ